MVAVAMYDLIKKCVKDTDRYYCTFILSISYTDALFTKLNEKQNNAR